MLGRLRSSDVYLLQHNGSSSAECRVLSRIALKIQPPSAQPTALITVLCQNTRQAKTAAEPSGSLENASFSFVSFPQTTALENYPPPPDALDTPLLGFCFCTPTCQELALPSLAAQGYNEKTSCVGIRALPALLSGTHP